MTAGSVDDGKSTLIGRLFYDLQVMALDQLESISREGLNFAFYTDGLREEREKGITIDVAYRYFESANRQFVVADTPGHLEYTRNMVTAATHVDAAVILVDATRGVREQTKRHAWISRWLGLHTVFLVNKMDAVGFSAEVFHTIQNELKDFPADFIPVAALHGDNVVHRSAHMPWYQGSTLQVWLDQLPVIPSPSEVILAVQLQSKDFHALGTLRSDLESDSEVFLGDRPIQVFTGHGKAGQAVRLRCDTPLNRGDILTSRPWKQNTKFKVEGCGLQMTAADAQLFLRFHSKELSVRIKCEERLDLMTLNWRANRDLAPNELFRGEMYCALALGEGVHQGMLTTRDGTVAALVLFQNAL